MKCFSFSLALTCLLSLQQSYSQTLNYDVANWKLYAFEKEGFSIRFPNHWITMQERGFVAFRSSENLPGAYDPNEIAGALIIVLPLNKYDTDDQEIARFETEKISGLTVYVKNAKEKFIEFKEKNQFIKLWLVPFTKGVLPAVTNEEIIPFIRQWQQVQRRTVPQDKMYERVYDLMFQTFEPSR
jgi:hypothetical protein